jgi:signal transduction histidine kinase
MPARAETDQLAEALARASVNQRRAGRALHDSVGPLLSAAGLKLQLLRMDFPDTAEAVRGVMGTLDEAMEGIRTLSQQLNPSPVDRVGLKNALAALAESCGQRFSGRLRFTFASSARLPVETAAAMYEAIAAALADAVERPAATRVDVSVRGSKSVRARVKDNGRPQTSHRRLAIPALLARHAGLRFEISTGKGTIVSIDHALRRPSRG